MNIFLDTEFTNIPSDETDSELISLGIYCEDGSHYYGVVADFDTNNLSDFVFKQVLPLLPAPSERKSRAILAKEVAHFLSTKNISAVWVLMPTLAQLIKLYGDADQAAVIYQKYADWDYQLLKQLVAEQAVALPENCCDLAPLREKLSKHEIPNNSAVHNALSDAQWNFQLWQAAKVHEA